MELPNLTTEAIGRDVVWLDEVDSTNNFAKHHAQELRHLTVVMAGRQTGGKGLRGRSWAHLPGESLYFSLIVKKVRERDLPRIPLLVALGVREGLEDLCGPGFGIKWSNDILFKSQKVCGILCESKIAAQSITVVQGIGVNIGQTRKVLDNHDLVYASSLFLATGKQFSAPEVAGALCNAMERTSLTLFREGFAPLRDRYRRHCLTLGRQVRVILDGREAVGTALDIDDNGCLLCEIDGEIVTINAGEASVRGLMGYA